MTTRIRLSDLERAARDPAGFRAGMDAPSRSEYRYGYFNLLRDTIRRFHDNGGDEYQARMYLESGLTRFKDADKKLRTMRQFEWYIQEYRSSGFVAVEVMGRVEARLPEWAPQDLVCSGEITRLDMIPGGGLAGWLFRNNDISGWDQELRMPLIQEALALEVGRDVEDVMVGVYGFQQRLVDQRTFFQGEVRSAHRRFEGLLRQLGF